MTLSVAGVGLLSLRRPFTELGALLVGKSDLRSLFCLVVFCIVFLVLAYLTNPSETSFRTYLTEQSFRQHLSRLDDVIDEDHLLEKSANSTSSFRPGATSARHTLPYDNRSPFHFANRASISLKTPKHVFHSFGIFTIAALVPLAKSDRLTQHDSSAISDSWFIGAFGKWWRGGVLEAWYQDVLARPSEEGGWSSGILGMKNMDKYHETNALPVLPYASKNPPPQLHHKGSPPRLRNREKSSQRSSVPRTSTPPPLPKSASLPLHAPRGPQTSDHNVLPSSPSPPHIQGAMGGENQASLAPPTTLSSLDQSPRAAELLRQITQSKASVDEVRNQLSECESSATQSHATLQSELDGLRERKRQEDSARTELKARTKALDDSKRTAESSKRETEKRLKAAQNARDDATERMDFLDREIDILRKRLGDDDASILQLKNGGIPVPEQKLLDSLTKKKKEVKVAEDVIAALNLRAKVLEEKLAAQKTRLRQARDQAENQKRMQPISRPSGNHSSTASQSSLGFSFGPRSPVEDYPTNPLPLAETNGAAHGFHKSNAVEALVSSRPTKLSLGGLSNFAPRSQPTTPHNGFSLYDESTTSLDGPANFSPFDDTPGSAGRLFSPTSTSLIPTGLISSSDAGLEPLSRSYRSETDGFLDRDWQRMVRNPERSPIFSTRNPSHSPELDRDPFEIRMLQSHGPQTARLIQEASVDIRTPISRPISDTINGDVQAQENGERTVTDSSASRNWFSIASRDRPKKGLNPEAKVFNFSGKPAIKAGNGHISQPSFDALNPNGVVPNIPPSLSADGSHFLRAFAPSPAEREALQRALGGSSNASLERLPSLSDVGSIPSSPSHIHAHALALDHTPRDVAKVIPSWLQSLPRIRKPNFSPWDDEER